MKKPKHQPIEAQGLFGMQPQPIGKPNKQGHSLDPEELDEHLLRTLGEEFGHVIFLKLYGTKYKAYATLVNGSYQKTIGALDHNQNEALRKLAKKIRLDPIYVADAVERKTEDYAVNLLD